MDMFCYQCEQTAGGNGCTAFGVCGKDPVTAVHQDLLVLAAKGISQYARRARALGASDREIDLFIVEALFTTVTNVNFDPESVAAFVRRGAELKARAKAMYERACLEKGVRPEVVSGPADWEPAANADCLMTQGLYAGIARRRETFGEDIAGLQELILYGLKGMAAYADHALILGREDESVFAFFHEALDFLAGNPEDVDELLSMCMRTGEVNLRVMELLDAANTGAYGHPEPTRVRITPRKGKCILVSGHDLKDLEELLKQTAGSGINVYTHGEMLPAHGYPGLKKYPHLAGNYGGAWQDQRREFEQFPGAILMTTNCIQKPKESYTARIFTCGLVRWPGVTHIDNRDFSAVIEAALEAPGFARDGEPGEITVGFARNAVLSVADRIVELVRGGKIRHFYLVGGCDGARPGRNYYTELAESAPEDTVILTLACGKFRFNKLELGEIEGIPRLLDVGQCNDAYSAIQIALALAKEFDCEVNDLPLSLILSWYEQKAVCILLTLLFLGMKNMRLGPSLPAFIGPGVLNALVEKFNLRPVTTVEKDLDEVGMKA